MGLFDKPQTNQDGKLRDLIGHPIFVQRYELRDVDTMYGPGTAIDLYILVGDTEKMYSGFSAGILAMLRQSEDGDFPVWVRIEEKQLRGGKSTLILVPSSEDEAPVPVQTAIDDDIPF